MFMELIDVILYRLIVAIILISFLIGILFCYV